MKKKKQHIIPKCYLENFTDEDGNLYVLELNEKKIFPTKPKKILTDNHFYTIKFPQGGGSLVVENTLEKIESKYASIFHNKIKERKPLDIEERALMSIFVATMLLRTEAFRKNIETPVRFFYLLSQISAIPFRDTSYDIFKKMPNRVVIKGF